MITMAPARRADVDEIAALLAHAFREDPPTRAMLRAEGEDLERRARHLYRALILGGPLQAGTVDVIREDGRILAAAIWHGPQDRGVSLRGRLSTVGDYLAAFGPIGVWRALRIQKRVDTLRPTEPHWYLHAVGVGPDARGKGIASRLLSYRLTVADADGVPTYLESSTASTGRLYARHGFVSYGPIEAWPDSPPHSMLRPVPDAEPEPETDPETGSDAPAGSGSAAATVAG